MKKYILPMSIALVASAALAVPADKPEKEPGKAEKVTICHATSSEGNPWVRIVVAEQAQGGHFENNGTPLAGHEDDVLLEGDVACPGETVTPPPVTPNPPVVTPNPVTPNPTVAPQPKLVVPTTLPAVGADGR